MKLHRNPTFVKFGGLVGTMAVRAWMSSLDCRVAYYDQTVDPVHPDYAGQKSACGKLENRLAFTECGRMTGSQK